MAEKNKTKQKYLDSSKKWKQDNKDKVNEQKREWSRRNSHKREEYRGNHRFGGNVQAVLERDNFQCQDCGMTQEQHIIIFATRLIIHHIDRRGRRHPNPNNDIDNLVCLCHECHTKVHQKIVAEERWGDLLEQDNSEYKYPKIRELVEKRAKELGGIQKAKSVIAEELNVSFWTIDTKCYERKEKFLLSEKDDE